MEIFFYFLIFSIPYLALSPWQRVAGVPTGIFFAGLVMCFVLGMAVQKPHLLKWKRIKRTPLIIPLLFFVAANLVSLARVIFSAGPGGLYLNNLKETGYLLFAVIFYWAAVNFIDNREKLTRSVQVFIAASTVASLYGIIRLFLHMLGLPLGSAQPWTVPRLLGTAGEAQVFGGLVITILPLAVASLLFQIPIFKAPGKYFAVLVLLAALVMTFAAGPWAGFGLSLIFLILWIRYYNLKRLLSLVLVFLVVGLGMVLLDRTVYPHYLEGFRSVTYKITGEAPAPGEFNNKNTDKKYLESVFSKVERSWFRTALWKMFKSSPVFGVGPGNFEQLYNEFRPEGTPSPPYVPKPHNQYLEILAETGLIGLLAFGSVIVNLIFLVFQGWPRSAGDDRKLLVGLVACLIAVGVHGYSFGILVHIQVWLLVALIASLTGSNHEINRNSRVFSVLRGGTI